MGPAGDIGRPSRGLPATAIVCGGAHRAVRLVEREAIGPIPEGGARWSWGPGRVRLSAGLLVTRHRPRELPAVGAPGHSTDFGGGPQHTAPPRLPLVPGDTAQPSSHAVTAHLAVAAPADDGDGGRTARSARMPRLPKTRDRRTSPSVTVVAQALKWSKAASMMKTIPRAIFTVPTRASTNFPITRDERPK